MSAQFKFLGILLLAAMIGLNSYAQDSTTVKKEKVVVIKNDGAKYIGYILSDDAREILIETDEVGKLYIPKHFIKSIKPYDLNEEIEEQAVQRDTVYVVNVPVESPSDSNSDLTPLSEDEEDSLLFQNFLSTKYIQSDNAFPLRRGESYIKFMPVGVEGWLPLTKNWSLAGWTSYLGFPMGIKTKYSFKLSEAAYLSADLTLGTMAFGSLADFSIRDRGLAVSSTLSFGDRRKNFSVKLGYAYMHEYWEGWTWTDIDGNVITQGPEAWDYHFAFTTFGGMFEIEQNTDLIVEAIFAYGEFGVSGAVGAAARFGSNPRRIWQAGGTIFMIDGTVIPIPMPNLSFTYIFSKRNTSRKTL